MNRRDIELLISARDTTGRSFKAVTDNITALNAKIAEQVQQAERGEISLNELRQSQEKLAQAGRDLSALQGQIDTYQKLLLTQEKVGTTAAKAQSDLAALSAAIATAGEATAAQERKLQSYEKRVASTSAAVEKNKNDITAQIAVLERAGIATNQLDTAQAGIVNSAKQVGAGVGQLNAAMDGYSTNIARARDAEQSLAAQNGFNVKIAQAKELGDASRFVQLFANAINTVEVADNKLAALNGFRAVGAMAAEASRDMSQFAVAGQAMAVSTTDIAQGLRSILQPGAEALRTIDGVEAAITTAGAAANKEKASVGELNAAYNDLANAGAALVQKGALIDSFERQAGATELARQQFQQAQADVQRLGNAMAQADAPTEALAADLKRAEAVLNETGRALTVEEGKLGELSRALKKAKIDTTDLAGAQTRLKAAAETAAVATAKINETTGRGGGKTNGLFGLRPNDLQNLGFQINDIVVSLISGQKPLTVLVQQGAQIAQIFPGLLSTVSRLALSFAPLIVGITLFGIAAKSAIQDAGRLDEVTTKLAASVNGQNYDPKAITAVAEGVEKLGASFDDALKAVTTFTNEGLSPDKINEYATAAFNLSQRLGIDVAQAAELVNGINVGGLQQLDDLQSKTGDLTTAEYDHAKALFEAGQAAEARQYILDIVAQRNQEIADASESQWTPAVNNLKDAFSGFADFLASVLFGRLTTLRSEIDNVAVGAAYLTGLLSGKGFQGALDSAAAVNKAQQNRGKPVAGGSTPQQVRDQQFAAQLTKEASLRKKLTDQQRRDLAITDARNKAQAAGVSKSLEELAVFQAIAKTNDTITKEKEAANKKSTAASNKAENSRKKAEREAEAAANRIANAQRGLQNQLRQLDVGVAKGTSADLEQRLEAIDTKYASIYDQIKKIQALGINSTADGTSFADVEKQVEAAKARLKIEETMKFYEEQVNLLTKQRSDELDTIADAQQRQAIGGTEALKKGEEVVSRLSPQIIEAAQKALAIAKSIEGTSPSPEMVSYIASLERVLGQEQGGVPLKQLGLDNLDRTSKQLDTLLGERDQLVSAYEELGNLGVKTSTEVRTLTAKAYADQKTAIEPVLTSLRTQLDLLRQNGTITQTSYDAWIAKIDAVKAGLQQTQAYLSPLESQTFGQIANAGAEAFGTLRDGISGLIDGSKSLGDVFADVGRSILQSLADITFAIAQAIIKFLILRALESAAGLPPGTLSGGGSPGGGLFGLFHSGGVVGSRGGRVRRDNPAMWNGAPKFHEGGGLGLESNEYRAILKRGEEVLTEDNPRHVNNQGASAGGGAAPQQNLKQVLLLSPDEIASAMQTRSGQRAFLTLIKTNKETVKQVLK